MIRLTMIRYRYECWRSREDDEDHPAPSWKVWWWVIRSLWCPVVLCITAPLPDFADNKGP